MKIYIMTDMEGVAGVVNRDDYTAPDSRCYRRACELTTLETNAAIEGALEAGATEFFVADGHGWGAIEPSLLHPAARVLTGSPLSYPFGCDASFDVAFIVGQHAKSNADGGHLSHTGSFEVDECSINGFSIGELGENMLFCAYLGVPTVFVAGDEACCDEAKTLVPEIETATVKWGLKRGSASGLTFEQNVLYNGAAVHLSPARSRELIRDGARRALSRRHEIGRFRMEPPYEMVTTFRRSAQGAGKRITRRADDLLLLLNGACDTTIEELD